MVGGVTVVCFHDALDGEFAQIVMSSHGDSGLVRLFLGSVAERVPRLADRPVLIVRSG
jgi:nucleotide-binding universal stress UspA family protein